MKLPSSLLLLLVWSVSGVFLAGMDAPLQPEVEPVVAPVVLPQQAPMGDEEGPTGS